jgi:aminopeptidase N
MRLVTVSRAFDVGFARGVLVAFSVQCGAILAAGCGSRVPEVSPGVSRELATYRAQALSDVSYEVTFVVPDDVSERVSGTVLVRFSLSHTKGPLILDFTAPPGSVLRVTSGDRDVPYTFAGAHIVIPRSAVHRGEQAIQVEFLAGDGALNRHEAFLYTLFVPDRASSAFPSFDQPDIKARYRLTLRVPPTWVAVANGPLQRTEVAGGAATFVFGETLPLSTYLFAFAAGEFAVEQAERDGRLVRMYHRETDTSKVARNLGAIFDLHATALQWLEEYTGIRYPYQKFDFVAIPSFQYGGMEHPGAILYRASSLFLDESATQNQLLGRASVIAHETAHMWFGDLVTMRWFDDVWMKEVFANFMAAKIVQPSFPDIDHDLRFYLAHHPSAYAVDRTAGANSIRQELGNLRDAGSLYGAIIYQKAPIVMRQLEGLLGTGVMRVGLRQYLEQYQWGNATWPDLITILDRLSPEDLRDWSRVWVEAAGRPAITATAVGDDSGRLAGIRVAQSDTWNGRGLRWNQRMAVALGYGDTVHVVPVQLSDAELTVRDIGGWPLPELVLPGADGLGYGHIVLTSESTQYLLGHLPDLEKPLHRSVSWMALWESVLSGDVSSRDLIALALRALLQEPNELVVQQVLELVEVAYWRFVDADARRSLAGEVETELWRGLDQSSTVGRRRAIFDALVSVTLTDDGIEKLERIWREQETLEGLPLAERQYTQLAEALAVRGVPDAEGILDAQHSRIENPDRRARFRFVRPALSRDRIVRDSVFESLKDAANREREPWVLAAVSFLHHPLRAETAIEYIRPSLELVEEIQRTGDIFFPLRWLNATLDGHQSAEAADIVARFLDEAPDYPPRLGAKIIQAADDLFRAARIVEGWEGPYDP